MSRSEVTLLLIVSLTRSSVVAERPRDASCLSVVSFSSTIARTPSFIISYFDYRFTMCVYAQNLIVYN